MYWIDTYIDRFAVCCNDEVVEIVNTREEAEMLIDLFREW